MSSGTQGSPTADTAIAQYLSNNPGWHEVSEIASATGFSHTHTLSVCKTLRQDTNSNVRGRKNYSKRVMGYEINGDLKVPGDDRQQVISLIRRHANGTPNLNQMSLDDLYNYLEANVATDSVPLEAKWEFQIP